MTENPQGITSSILGVLTFCSPPHKVVQLFNYVLTGVIFYLEQRQPYTEFTA